MWFAVAITNGVVTCRGYIARPTAMFGEWRRGGMKAILRTRLVNNHLCFSSLL